MRIRSIHPQFWRSNDIAALRRDHRLLFIGLWSYVDDNGVGQDDHRAIAADLFALEDDPIGARSFVREGLATLSRALLIVRYTHESKPLLYVPTFDKWQRVDRPSKPRYPRPDEASSTLTSDDVQKSEDTRDTLASPRETLALGEGEKGRRGEGEKTSSALTRDGDGDRPDIDRLCAHLADRIEANGSKRPVIGKRWRDAARLMLDRDGRTEDQIHAAIDWCQSDEFWRANVMSMQKLREKYDQMRLQAQRRNGTGTQRQQETDAMFERAMQRARAREAAMGIGDPQ